MVTITLKGREIPLEYTTLEMLAIQEATGKRVPEVIDCLGNRNEDGKSDIDHIGTAEHLAMIGKVVTILGNSGLKSIGENPDLTEEMVLRSIKPTGLDIQNTANACLNAMAEGMKSEIQEQDDGPVDVILEEMNRKKGRAS